MKKLILILILISFNANAANFTDTLGAQCGEILLKLEHFDYPGNYDTIKKRNSQLWALKKCLETYKENGGTMEKLNIAFAKAIEAYNKDFDYCVASKMEIDKCMSPAKARFKDNMVRENAIPVYYKD